jgi:hypothetical protein
MCGERKMNCQTCGCEISKARLEALPYTTTCVNCSKAKPYVGFMDWYHKTAPELVMINSGDKENIRRAQRISNRAR